MKMYKLKPKCEPECPEPKCDGYKPTDTTNLCKVADKPEDNEYLLYREKDGKCETDCVKEKDFEKKFKEGYKCEPCIEECCPPPEEPPCETKYGVDYVRLFRPKDGECEEKCVPPKDVPKKFSEGYGCDCTPPPPGEGDCDLCGKPTDLKFRIVNGLETNTTQKEGKYFVEPDQVFVVVPDIVPVSSDDADLERVDDEFRLFNIDGSNTQFMVGEQLINYHTSCSAPIVCYEVIGNVQLVGYLGEKNCGCGSVEL
jgi:hypothetical protein